LFITLNMKVGLIWATSREGLIGDSLGLPWRCQADLKHFRAIIKGQVVIVGYRTFKSLPPLPFSHMVIVKPRDEVRLYPNDNMHFVETPWNAYDTARELVEGTDKEAYVIGGGKMYNFFIDRMYGFISKLVVSIIDDKLVTQNPSRPVYLNPDLSQFKRISNQQRAGFRLEEWVPRYPRTLFEAKYTGVVSVALNEGHDRLGRNGYTRGVFGRHIDIDLRHGFPLMSHKKMFMRGIIEELLFFLRGDTQTKVLADKGVNIWKGNTSQEFLEQNDKTHLKPGEMGPMYGYQFRHFNKPWGEAEGGVDQLANVVRLIRTSPTSRRIMMTTYNPAQAEEGVLYPCHSIVLQFYVEGKFIDVYCYNRSSDLILGLPFNIASTSLLLLIIAQMTGKIARRVILSLGDCHIYESHMGAAKQLLDRSHSTESCYVFINRPIRTVKDINNLKYTDFILWNYKHRGPPIKVSMIP